MGHKINPIALRLQLNRQSDSCWYTDFKYAEFAVYESAIRSFIQSIYSSARLVPGRILSHKNVYEHSLYVLGSVPEEVKNKGRTSIHMNNRKRKGVSFSENMKMWNASNVLSDGIEFYRKEKQQSKNIVSRQPFTPIFSSFFENEKKIGFHERMYFSSSEQSIFYPFPNHYSTIDFSKSSSYFACFYFLFHFFQLHKKHSVGVFHNQEIKTLLDGGNTNESVSGSFDISSFFPFFLSNSTNTLNKKKSLSYYRISKEKQEKETYLLKNHIDTFLKVKSGFQTRFVGIQTKDIFQDATLFASMVARGFEQKRSLRQLWFTILEEVNRLNKKKSTSPVHSEKTYKRIKGIRLVCAGRINGAEMARIECKKWGQTPLASFHEKIDYAKDTAHTVYGCIGIKVWICYQ